MRVTQSQITRQYINSSNSALDNMNKINQRVLTQRKFEKASEDSVSAAHALLIRRNLDNVDLYKDNISSANGILGAGETALLTVSSITTTVTDSILSGTNGDKGDDERNILANQLENLGKEMISQVNTKFADRYLFGGSNNENPPYTYDKTTGVVSYNGQDINANQNAADFPQSKPIAVDIGLGIKFNDDGTVDNQTVMDISMNGAEQLGCGTDNDGDPNNLIGLTFKAADAVRNNDMGTARKLVDKINSAKSNVLIGITNIGNKEQTLDFSKERVEDDEISLKTSQQSVEGIDLTEEATNYKVAQMAYNATLSMGGKVIPNSIFDFIR